MKVVYEVFSYHTLAVGQKILLTFTPSNKENVMQAEKAVQIAGKRYEVGKGTVLELNTSQVQLTEAELTYNQSIYDYLVAKADLDQVLGRDYISKDQK